VLRRRCLRIVHVQGQSVAHLLCCRVVLLQFSQHMAAVLFGHAGHGLLQPRTVAFGKGRSGAQVSVHPGATGLVLKQAKDVHVQAHNDKDAKQQTGELQGWRVRRMRRKVETEARSAVAATDAGLLLENGKERARLGRLEDRCGFHGGAGGGGMVRHGEFGRVVFVCVADCGRW